MNEPDRILYNKNKLQELYPYFRVRIEEVIKEIIS